MIGKILGLGSAARDVGQAVGSVAEVFVGNRAERDAADLERFNGALAQFGNEFGKAGAGRFDGFVNGLNRLPRPMMALGTLGLFAFAMVDPHGFATRMQGLAYIPEPLWWLLGAVVSFYFGARELHHYRGRKLDLPAPPPRPAPTPRDEPRAEPAPANAPVRPAAARPEPKGPASAPSGTAAADPAPAAPVRSDPETGPPPAAPSPAAGPDFNAAVEEWRAAARA